MLVSRRVSSGGAVYSTIHEASGSSFFTEFAKKNWFPAEKVWIAILKKTLSPDSIR